MFTTKAFSTRRAAYLTVAIAGCLLTLTITASAATVVTDKSDYSPGDRVAISGTGFQPGETVTVVISSPVSNPTTLTGAADANGSFANNQYLVQQSDVGHTLTVSATGQTSGIAAQITFADSGCGPYLVFQAPFARHYACNPLPSIPTVGPGYPTPNVGTLWFLDNNNLLFLYSNGFNNEVWKVPVVRGPGNHITGFGTPFLLASNDSGYYNIDTIFMSNSGDVLFGSGTYLNVVNGGYLYQYKSSSLPGSGSNPFAKFLPSFQNSYGCCANASGIVPPGFGGAGNLKFATGWTTGQPAEWYNVALTPDGNGTYNTATTLVETLTGQDYSGRNYPGPYPGRENISYVHSGSPGFTQDSIIMAADYMGIATATVNANGDPDPNSYQVFMTTAGTTQVVGGTVDPVTNDYLSNTGTILLITGFTPPTALNWMRFLGGTGNDYTPRFQAVAVDSNGNAYIAGTSTASWGGGRVVRLFSTFSSSPGSSANGFVAKLDPSGNLVWVSFLGGSSGLTEGDAIAVDSSGNSYMVGTSSAGWGSPVNAYGMQNNLVVAKLDPNGNLLWNSFGGGMGANNVQGYSVAVDSSGNVYAGGYSEGTPNFVNFPPPRRANQIGGDGWVAKYDPSGHPLWFNWLGNASSGFGQGVTSLAVDNAGNVFATLPTPGDTNSGMPSPAWNNAPAPVRPPTASFCCDTSSGTVVKLRADNGDLTALTFVDSSAAGHHDRAMSVTVAGGSLYVVGDSNNSWGSPMNAFSGSQDIFLAKLDTNLNLQWVEFMGGAGSSKAAGVTVDSSGNVWMVGTSTATWGSPARAYTAGLDAVAIEFDPAARTILWNAFLGGSGDDSGNGIAAGAGTVYVAGYSPTTWGSPLVAFAGGANDVFIQQISGVAPATTFSDGTFQAWTTTQTQSNTSGIATTTQFSSGGNPGSYIQIQNQTGDSGSFYGVIFDPVAVYNPANGAISSISGSYDTISNINGNGQCTGFALIQSGVIYVGWWGDGTAIECGYYNGWRHVTWNNLVPSYFRSCTSNGCPGAIHPDFSTAGAPITFGLTTFNTGSGRTTLTDFDNFSLSLNP